MLGVDLSDKVALVAGVADDGGFGFAIAKALAEAEATVCVATWPPAFGIFTTMLERGKFDKSRQLSSGELLEFDNIYPFDAEFDSYDDIPEDTRSHRRYRDHGDVSITGLAARVKQDYPNGIDIVVHSLANGSEVQKPLLETSRRGYLSAVGASAYSFVGLARATAPLMNKGGAFLALSYLASQRVVPGYGGGMSSAKAALESDTQVLAYELGRGYGVRANVISAGPFKSRAAAAIGAIDDMIEQSRVNSPLPQAIEAKQVGHAAAFLCSSLASGVTGSTLYVDNGYHAMGRFVGEDAK